jgi:catechol 2,3-dioxygenase-like lactoylglutathione lyase family enzyme
MSPWVAHAIKYRPWDPTQEEEMAMPTDANPVGSGDADAVQDPEGRSLEASGSQAGLKIGAIVIMCNDFERTVAFWHQALRYEAPRQPGGPGFAILGDPAGTAPNVSVQETDLLKFGRNRMHLDLYADDQKSEVERLLRLGATIHDAPEGGKDYVIMADPEGKLFCVVGLDESRYWSPTEP